MTDHDVIVDLSKNEQRLEVKFPYDPKDLKKIQSVTGRNWSHTRGVNTVPANLHTARKLRELFGPRMKLTKRSRQWAHRLVRKERMMQNLHIANDASLASTPRLILDAIEGLPLDLDLPPRHPFGRERDERPYQRADIKLMGLGNAMNLNDVGTGKTLESIGAIYEAGLYPGSGIIVAPRRTLVPVWQRTFNWFTDYQFLTSDKPAERKEYIKFFAKDRPEKTVLGLIADDLRLIRYCTRAKRDEWIKKNKAKQHPLHATQDLKGAWYCFKDEFQQALYDVELAFINVDEFHSTGLNNRESLFHQAIKIIVAERKWFMSATPMGGKAERLWPVLHLLDPKKFSSSWNWFEEWLEIELEEFYRKGDRGGMPSGTKKVLKGLKPGIEDRFYYEHRQHMTRRAKRDALPGLPPIVEIEVETPMLPEQRRQYTTFDEEHEIIMGKKRLSGNIVLTQYLRLRQIANAVVEWDQFYTKPVATGKSGKLEYLFEKLDENGVRPNLRGMNAGPEPRARAYVGVLEVEFANVVAKEIQKYGVDAAALHGKTKEDQFELILKRFESEDEEPFVIVMTMQTGGAGLDLQQAGSAHALDDPWDPDISYQFFGRGDRGSRETALKCYSYVTPDSIQEYVRRVAGDKKLTNRNILNYSPDIEALRKAR